MSFSEKLHIGIFGKTNIGKSTLMNLLTGQNTSIVSPTKGTTTDPVKKSIEILDLGSAILYDTAGLEDNTDLGMDRISKTMEILKQINFAIYIVGDSQEDEVNLDFIQNLKNLKIPYLIIENKFQNTQNQQKTNKEILSLNLAQQENAEVIFKALKEKCSKLQIENSSPLHGLIQEKDLVLLIAPIDSQAPKGRLILPQVQLIRQCLDLHATAIVCQQDEVRDTIQKLGIQPALAITDSQIFHLASELIPPSIPLTSFSILLAKQKGNFDYYLSSTPSISELKDNDKILILESCTHQTNCEDIGRVKIPALLRKYTKKNLNFDFVSGLAPIPVSISDYQLIIQCGACMISQNQLKQRLQPFINQNIPCTNYGLAIAYVTGIFERATQIFKN